MVERVVTWILVAGVAGCVLGHVLGNRLLSAIGAGLISLILVPAATLAVIVVPFSLWKNRKR